MEAKVISDNILYNVARAVTLAFTGKELHNEDITDEQHAEALRILRSLVKRAEWETKHGGA